MLATQEEQAWRRVSIDGRDSQLKGQEDGQPKVETVECLLLPSKDETYSWSSQEAPVQGHLAVSRENHV